MNNDPANPAPQPGPTGPDRAEAIFDEALPLPVQERAACLDRACGDDAQLRRCVEDLLKAHDQAGGFLEQPAAPASAKTIVLTLPPSEKPGDWIGRYKILQQIGEGGCGVVYMAEQEEPVRRRVALKVIKLGMDTKSVIARFEAERQALALMDHPNIARVLDAGATANGRPFFVMELVRGIKITDYCDQNKLATDERLKLFIQVCHAIQHAHQKGIIHRDIKPSNILVTLHDGVPVPKVIDFGIAKATQGRLTDQTLFTAFEQFIGTPAYMSPEQAEMSGLDIDTRCDIYALGVLLYELLTGQTPFDARELIASGLDKMRHTIREQEPQRPSTRLSTMLNAELTATANCRRTEAPKLIHMLSGDLDWIVMKALEKDRTRRYETANGLGLDVQRLMENEPVMARPPSSVYRFQKLVRRNRLAFTAATCVVAALALGMGASMYLFVQERKAHKRADEAERIQATLAREAEAGRLLEIEKRRSAEIGQMIGMAALYMTQDKLDEAEKQISPVSLSVLTNHVTTAFIFNVLGDQHARHGRWQPAITNYSKIVQIVPHDFPGYHALAALFVQTGDAAAGRLHRERMLREFARTTDPVIAIGVVEDCLVLPPNADELETAGKMADLALAVGSDSEHWRDAMFAKGLAEYRLGRYAGAADWFQKEVAQDRNAYLRTAGQFALAMAKYQLNQMDAARDSMVEALDLAGRKLPNPDKDKLDEEWPDWVTAQALKREAESLFKNAGPAAKLAPAPEADWQDVLRKAGYKFTCAKSDDGTWELNLDDQPISDLSPLRGAQLNRLSLMRTEVTDLGPLRGMPLKWLRLGSTKVTDLGPLEGMQLVSLQVSGTAVTDLTPIHGMPLRTLMMTDCKSITNLAPLAGITTFETVVLPPNAKGFEFLRGQTNLTRIGFHYDQAAKRPDHSAAEFWAEFDKTNAAKP